MSVKSETLRLICMEGCLDTIGYIWQRLYLLDKKDRDEEGLQEMKAFLKENRDIIVLCPFPTRLALFCVLHSNLITIFGCYYTTQIYRRLHGIDQML